MHKDVYDVNVFCAPRPFKSYMTNEKDVHDKMPNILLPYGKCEIQGHLFQISDDIYLQSTRISDTDFWTNTL